jgi:ferritin-like metal-binding protein YciE
MDLFNKVELNAAEDMFQLKLQDLYDAEQRLTEALPKMAEAASDQQLRAAFRSHLKETEQHVARLEKVFNQMGCQAQRHTCQAMKGLIAEGEELIKTKGDSRVKDEALVSAAQGVEHYEIAAYRNMRDTAERLGLDGAADLFRQTLDEELNADKTLRELALRASPRAQKNSNGKERSSGRSRQKANAH